MNTTRNITKNLCAAAVLATAVLTLSGSPASAVLAQEAGQGTTIERERGVVLDCHGEADGLEVYASLYENNLNGNHVQVVIGDPDAGHGNSKWVDHEIHEGSKVRAAIKVDGERAVVRGTATRVGKKTPVHESFDDAGYAIEIDGTHKRLRTDLVLRYDGTKVPLTCDDAFVYDLLVKKTPIV
jgi:hypothetical protein